MYDIIIIGAGSGGLNSAVFMAKTGFKVLLIDKSDKHIGGDCLNTGCIPSKSFIHIAREVMSARNAAAYGITVHNDVDLSLVMKSVQEKIETIRVHENAEHFKSLGIDVAIGNAFFTDVQEVTVEGVGYSGKKIILATGSRPRTLTIKGAEKSHIITNEEVFTLTALPKKLVVIGVGPIGIELGQAFSMLGSEVTFIGSESRILPREKEEYAQVLHESMKQQGATFVFNSEVVRIENNTTLIVRNKITQEEFPLLFDTVLVAVGRELNIENLGLDTAGILIEKGKIVVNDYLQTTNKNVYVSGDIAGGYQFTHAAELHTQVLLHNFFSPLKKKLTYDTFSWVTYTTPELATFGLSEELLIKRGVKYEKLETTFKDDDRAITSNSTYGKSEVYIDVKSKVILGGTMVADNAGELIQEFILAMQAKIPITQLFNKIYPYPTATRVNKKLISEYFKKRFSSTQKMILGFLFKVI